MSFLSIYLDLHFTFATHIHGHTLCIVITNTFLFCFVLNLHISGPIQFKSMLFHGQLCSPYKTLNSLRKKYYNHSLKYIFNSFSPLLFLYTHLNKNHGLNVVCTFVVWLNLWCTQASDHCWR